MINLIVKTLDSRNHSFTVPDDLTVKQLKERIADTVNVPADSQRLIYCGRVLQDDKNLSEYDVNGKVIHLVQRAPPLPNNGNSENGAARANQPHSRSGSTTRRRFFQTPGTRIDTAGGNAMYLGAMAFPADLMESQGLAMPQPRQCLSQSRLNVARHMLTRAGGMLTRLEHPNLYAPPQNASSDTSPDTNANVNVDESLPSSISVAAQMATAAAIAAAVSAAQGNVSHEVEVRTEEEPITAPAPAASVAASESTTTPQEQSSQPQPSQSSTSGGDTDNPQTESTSRSRYPRTTAMAELLDTLANTNRRLQPFLDQFHQTMREDPVLTAPQNTQRVFSQVSEIFHFLSHAYHALSDIMCDFSQPPPRYLQCRPVLIQHSAVVQTSVPIQAQINVTANPVSQSAAQQASSQSQNRETAAAEGASEAAGSAPDSGDATAPAAPEPQSGAAAATAADSGTTPAAENGGAQSSAESNGSSNSRSQPTQGRAGVRGSRSLNFGGPNFEFFMDVSPGSITIDSLETTVLTNGSPNNPNEINIMGGFPFGAQPQAEFIQNLMQALAGGPMGSDNGAANRTAPATTSSTSTTTTATTQQPTSTTQQTSASASSASTANSQARGNTGTYPTTSTQTRSTSRPHVNLSPATVQGLGASSFDPYLPCNSHHIRVYRRRNSQQQAHASAATQQQSAQQTNQQTANAAQQPGQTSTSQTTQSSRSATVRPRVEVAPMPAANRPEFSDRATATSDTAINNLVTVVMNMANRSMGRLVTTRTNTATNTTDSGATRVEGENVTVTTQTPPIQVLPSALLQNINTNNSGSVQTVPLPPGYPITFLNQLAAQAMNARANGTVQSSSVLSEIMQLLPDFSYTQGESMFLDLSMALVQSLTVVDMLNLAFGDASGLRRARPRLREFVRHWLLTNQPFSLSAAVRGSYIFNAQLRPFLENVTTMRENHLREDIDLIATINQFNEQRIPAIIATLFDDSDENYHQMLFCQCQDYINYLFAIIRYCCLEPTQGLENIITEYVRLMTTGIPEQVQSSIMSVSLESFRQYLSSVVSRTNPANIYRFIVYRGMAPDMATLPSTPPMLRMDDADEDETPSTVEPMIIEAGCISTFEEETASSLARSSELPEVLIGAEDWHNSLPSDWVPIITRDSQRQRRQNTQTPFSDAYISGMPSKRRKIITSKKPQGSISQLISENMQAAVGAAGVTAPGVEVEVVAQGAGSDSTLRLAYRDQIRASIRRNLHSHPDYSSDKYPNAAKYFGKKKKK